MKKERYGPIIGLLNNGVLVYVALQYNLTGFLSALILFSIIKIIMWCYINYCTIYHHTHEKIWDILTKTYKNTHYWIILSHTVLASILLAENFIGTGIVLMIEQIMHHIFVCIYKQKKEEKENE